MSTIKCKCGNVVEAEYFHLNDDFRGYCDICRVKVAKKECIEVAERRAKKLREQEEQKKRDKEAVAIANRNKETWRQYVCALISADVKKSTPKTDLYFLVAARLVVAEDKFFEEAERQRVAYGCRGWA